MQPARVPSSVRRPGVRFVFPIAGALLAVGAGLAVTRPWQEPAAPAPVLPEAALLEGAVAQERVVSLLPLAEEKPVAALTDRNETVRPAPVKPRRIRSPRAREVVRQEAEAAPPAPAPHPEPTPEPTVAAPEPEPQPAPEAATAAPAEPVAPTWVPGAVAKAKDRWSGGGPDGRVTEDGARVFVGIGGRPGDPGHCPPRRPRP
jgi:hypothetical protein